jgi:hypothetical protein
MVRIGKYMTKGKTILMLLALTLFVNIEAMAHSCEVQYQNGKQVPECPNGKITRKDISPKCIEDTNAGTCVNTMPTSGVLRIPEDVCYRGTGWDRQRDHQGMDYAAELGAPITAAANGTIIRATGNIKEPSQGGSCSGYGNVIDISHKPEDGACFAYTTRYAHLNKLAAGIKEGSKVKKGDVIGYVGGTGGACGRAHLHFEMRIGATMGGALLNPMCDSIQEVCNCKTPTPSAGLSACRDATFLPGAPANVAYNTVLDSMPKQPGEQDSDYKLDLECSYSKSRDAIRNWGCIFCKPFAIIFNTASVMAAISFNTLADVVAVIMVIAFAIWLAITTLRFVSYMETREPGIFVKTVLNQAFRVLVIYILLKSNLTGILAMTLDPVFLTGLNLAQTAGRINTAACDLGDLTVMSPEDGGGLSREMGMGILCTIKSVQDQIGDIMALGSLNYCMSWRERVLFIFPHLGYFITGTMLYIGSFLLLFIYPFLLVDCVLKLAIAIALFPAALGAFAFKITSKYLQKIWETFLNAMFSFIFLSIIILIISTLAAEYMADIIGRPDEVSLVDELQMKPLMWWTVDILKIIFVCFLGWAVLEEVKDFSSKFASRISTNDSQAATGSTAAEFGMKKPGMWAGKKAVQGSKSAAKAGGRWMSEKGHQANIRFAQFRGKGREMKDEKGDVRKDADGNVIYDTANAWQRFRGKAVESSFTKDENGNVKMTSKKKNKDGTFNVKTTDSFGTVKQTLASDGQTHISKETKVNAVGLKYLTYKDGSVNTTAMNNFLQNSMLSEEDKRLLIMEAVINQRMSGAYGGKKLDDVYKDRQVGISQDKQGREVTTVTQTNIDGTKSTFVMTRDGGDRIMTYAETVNDKGAGYGFATDGIVERKTKIFGIMDKNGKWEGRSEQHKYAVASYYDSKTKRPLYTDGDMATNIPKDQIMFGKEDMDRYVQQVATKGNKYYKFNEFN